MSDEGARPSAADVAAQQVEEILSAAEKAAEEIKRTAAAEAEEMRSTGRREAGRELEQARKKAIELGADARTEAKRLVENATKESEQIREQTRRQVEGRVSEAQTAAAQVLEEARTLSSGLRQLGTTLQSQGERILRDVQAAHKRMQADLRISGVDEDLSPRRTPGRTEPRPLTEEEPSPRAREPVGTEAGSSRATPEEREAIERAAERLGLGERRTSARERGNPIEDFDVPTWVGRRPGR